MTPRLASPPEGESASAAGTAPDPEALYDAEIEYVWNSLRRLGIPPRDRDDLSHDVFLAAFRRLDSFDPTRPLRPWLFGIALRVAARYRELARHVREVSTLHEAEDPLGGPELAYQRTEAQRFVERCLQAVELNRRAVFILHDIDEHPIPEVARALDLPVNTAYSRLRLARAEFTAEAHRLKGGTR